MEQYYAESVMLSTVSLDSVKSFSGKVEGYVTRYPEAKQHRRYAQIQKNIKAASIRFNITINYNWDGADTIYF